MTRGHAVRLALALASVSFVAAAEAEYPLVPGQPVGTVLQVPRWQVEGRYWFTNELRDAALIGGPGATRLDLVNELGLEEEDVPELALAYRTGPFSKLRFSYARIELDAQATAARGIVFGGFPVQPGARVVTELEQNYFKLDWVWQPIGNQAIRFGPIIGAHGWTSRLRLESGASGRTETLNDANVAFGLALDIVPHRVVDIYVEASGMDSGAKGWHLDAEGGLRIWPSNSFGVLVSYRRLEMRIEDDSSDDHVDWLMEGPMFGVSFRF